MQEHGILRKRLCNQICEKQGVYFISGRPGSGKTLLMRQAADRLGGRLFWYSFQKEDNLENNLRQGLARLLGKTGDGKGIPDLLDELAEDTVRCLVLDNFQNLHNRHLLKLFQELLEKRMGLQWTLFACSDHIESCFAAYLAKGNYAHITEKQIDFSREELKALVFGYFGESPKEADLEHLWLLTEGWALAAVFVLRFLLEQEQPFSEICKLSRDRMLRDTLLYDYIEAEVYGRFGMEERRFLAKVSVFESLDVGLCSGLLGDVMDEKALRKCRAMGLYRTGGESFGLYRQFQPLIRAFLQMQVTEKEKQLLSEQAGEYYLKRQDYRNAFHYSKGRPELVRKLFLISSGELLHRGLLEIPGMCLEVLEQTELDWTVSELELAAAYYYLSGDRQKLEYYLNSADMLFGKENKYAMYRSLYRGLFSYEKEPEKYEKQVSNVLFFLKENKLPLPILNETDQKTLGYIVERQKQKTNQEKKATILVSMFGTFKVVILDDGHEAAWRTRKGAELFAYLVLLNGEAVERNTLLNILWQEDMPDHAVAMLHNILYNIRKELSFDQLENLIQYKNRKYLMDMSLIETDYFQVRQLADWVEGGCLPELLEHRSGFDTYWGCFLENLDNLWIRELQGYFEKIYERGCFLLGTEFMNQENWEDARHYLKNALDISKYSERIMEMLLQCDYRLGDFKSMRTRYEAFCMLLQKDLNMMPGEELAASYRKCLERNGQNQ